jgi:hypothetical protein
MLDDGYWWTKTNYNVSCRGTESQRTGKNNSDQPFMKHSFPFPVTYRKPSRNSAKAAVYFNSSPRHSGCWHWQANSVSFFALSQESLQ